MKNVKVEIKEKLISNSERIIRVFGTIAWIINILLGVDLVTLGLAKIMPEIFLYQISYKVVDILFEVGLVIVWCILTCMDSLKAIRHAIEDEQLDIYKNNLLNVILSDCNTLNTFFCACTFTSLIFNWNILLSLIVIILWLVAPSKISKKFKNKLIREKEL